MYKPAPFNDLNTQFARSARITLIVLALSCAAVLWGKMDTFIWGLVLGGATGILNALFLRNRLQGLFELDKAQAVASLRQNYAIRFLAVLAVVFFASRVEFMSVYGVGAGLMLVPFITSVDAAITALRHVGARDAVDKI